MKPKLKLNPSATWINNVRNLFEQLLQQRRGGICGIPLAEFNARDWKAKNQVLRQKLPEVLADAQVTTTQSLCCPMHDDETPSLTYRPLALGFHCYVCAERPNHVWDLFDLIGMVFGVVDFGKQRQLAIQMFVGDGSGDSLINEVTTPLTTGASARSTPIQQGQSASSQRYPVYYSDPLCRDFVTSRGITAEFAMRFGLRRMEVQSTQDRYLVIPCENRFAVFRRYLHVHGHAGDDYRYPANPGRDPDLEPRLFNGRCLGNFEKAVIFVVESALDAILIMQSGNLAVALNGVNGDLLLQRQEVLRTKGHRLVLLLDNDPDGTAAQKEQQLWTRLLDQGIMAFSGQHMQSDQTAFLQDYKDVGEAYLQDPAGTQKGLYRLMKYAYAQDSCSWSSAPERGEPWF